METKLNQLLNTLLQQHNIAGMSVAVTDRKQVLYAKGFGVESLERPSVPTSPESMYRIASITKVITGITVLRLVQQGILNLDLPIRQYLPQLQLRRQEALEQMTLRHLLSHTAGFPAEYTPNGPKEESALGRTLLEGLPELELTSLPNDGAYLYSNWGIRLVSYIAQLQTGRLYSELATEYALKPLGMTRTTFDLNTAATYPLSLPHDTCEDGTLRVMHRLDGNAARLAAGGLYSNAIDLCHLARFLLNAGTTDEDVQLLSNDLWLQMCRPHAARNETGDYYGLTLMLHKYHDRHLLGHLGSAPPYATSIFTDPKTGYGIVTLMNTDRKDLRLQIPQQILDILNP